MAMQQQHYDVDRVLQYLHEKGTVNASALIAVLQEMARGEPLSLDQLSYIFGVSVIYALVSTPKQEADRARLHREFNDLAAKAAEAPDSELLQAFLQLITLLRAEMADGRSL